MGVVGEGQSVVADVVGGVVGFGHRTYGQRRDDVLFGAALDLLEELMAEEAAQKGENPDIVRSIPICTIKVPENNENGGGE